MGLRLLVCCWLVCSVHYLPVRCGVVVILTCALLAFGANVACFCLFVYSVL